MNYQLATIEFKNWKQNAILTLTDGRSLIWKMQSFWKSKWQISDDNLYFISYKGLSHKGSAETENYDDLIFMSGYFVYVYFENLSQTAAAT